jgi:hypothetical protein
VQDVGCGSGLLRGGGCDEEREPVAEPHGKKYDRCVAVQSQASQPEVMERHEEWSWDVCVGLRLGVWAWE